MRRFCQTMRLPQSAVVIKAARCMSVCTKDNPVMKHLDVYARRDPQLAPYLLREVDIEYKRKCQKSQLQAEQAEVMIVFAEVVRKEQDARDEDFSIRRRLFGKYLAIVTSSFRRDQTWNDADSAKVTALFENATKEASST